MDTRQATRLAVVYWHKYVTMRNSDFDLAYLRRCVRRDYDAVTSGAWQASPALKSELRYDLVQVGKIMAALARDGGYDHETSRLGR